MRKQHDSLHPPALRVAATPCHPSGVSRVARRVALLCIDPWKSTERIKPFNYAARKVQASLAANRALDVDVQLIESRSTDVDDFVARVEAVDPDVVAASAYVWSFPTFVEAARKLKAHRPDRAVVFGGPSARPAMFSLSPWRDDHDSVDALALGEGEGVLRKILALPEIDRHGLATVAGLAVATPTGWRATPEAPRTDDLDALASPYQMGLTPGDVLGQLETYRGCPLSCSFCQWGDANGNTRIFSTDAIARELEAFARLGLEGAILVDAALNLNPRAFRNLVAAERRVRFFAGAHLDCELYPSHLTEEHAAFLAEVRQARVGIGLQSLDPVVLTRLNRPFDVVRFEKVVREMSTMAGVTIEIILGLPGDNPASFRRTLDRARSLPAEVRVFHCLALPDALMTRLPQGLEIDFDPYTLALRSATGWTAESLLTERSRLDSLVSDAGGWTYENAWTFPGPPSVARELGHLRPSQVAEAPPQLARQGDLAATIGATTGGAWALSTLRATDDTLLAEVSSGDERVVLQIRTARPGERAYRVVEGTAYSYTGQRPSNAGLRMIELLASRLGPVARELLRSLQPPARSLPILP